MEKYTGRPGYRSRSLIVCANHVGDEAVAGGLFGADPYQLVAGLELGDGHPNGVAGTAVWLLGEHGDSRWAEHRHGSLPDRRCRSVNSADQHSVPVPDAVGHAPTADHVEPGEPGGERGARMPHHLLRRTRLHDPAAVHDEYAMSQQQGVEQIVGDDDRRPVRQHLPQHAAQRRRGADVQSGHRFVEQQQVGRGRQRPRDRDPLSLSSRQLSRLAGGELLRPHLAQPPIGRAPGSGRALTAGSGSEGDVVPYGQVREEERILGQHGGAARPRRATSGPTVPARRRTTPVRRAPRVRRRGAGCRRGWPAPWTSRLRSARAARPAHRPRVAGRPRGGARPRVARMVRVIGGHGSAR